MLSGLFCQLAAILLAALLLPGSRERGWAKQTADRLTKEAALCIEAGQPCRMCAQSSRFGILVLPSDDLKLTFYFSSLNRIHLYSVEIADSNNLL